MDRRVLGGLAGAVLVVSWLISGGLAQASLAKAPQAPGLRWVRVLHLHHAYERALGHAKPGPILGVIRPAGYRSAASGQHLRADRPSATCAAEPNCPMTYHGGLVQHHPRVYLLLWGPNWQTDAAQEAGATYLANFFQGLGVRPQDTWSATMAQYHDGTGFPVSAGSVFAGTFNDTSQVPADSNRLNFVAETSAFMSTQHITAGQADDQLVIATQSGACPDGFAGPGCLGGGWYCAYHSYAGGEIPFTNLPYQPDAGSTCGANSVSGDANGPVEGFSIVGGHEYAETVTDPFGTGWYDKADFNVSGGEVGDKCSWVYPGTTTSDISMVTLSTGSFAMQPLFSNNAYAAKKKTCVTSAAADKVTVTRPASKTSLVGRAASLQVAAKSSTGSVLSYFASGLPPGLKVSSSTGLIAGTPKATGTYSAELFVSDRTEGYATTSFTWKVKPRVGHLTGARGLCAAAYRNATANGTWVVSRACGTSSGENWTMTRWPASTLTTGGVCLTDPKSGGTGTRLALGTCTAASTAQQWRHRGNGEWVLALNGLCLNEPGTAAGTRLTVSTCTDAASQRWSVP